MGWSSNTPCSRTSFTQNTTSLHLPQPCVCGGVVDAQHWYHLRTSRQLIRVLLSYHPGPSIEDSCGIKYCCSDTIKQSHQCETDCDAELRRTYHQGWCVEKMITLSAVSYLRMSQLKVCIGNSPRYFVHARSLITQWKDAITKLYSDRNDLHDLIPSVSRLCISRLDLKSFTTTDTCATERNPRRVDQVECRRKGLSVDGLWGWLLAAFMLCLVWRCEFSFEQPSEGGFCQWSDWITKGYWNWINLDIDDLFWCIDKKFMRQSGGCKSSTPMYTCFHDSCT